MKRGDVVSADKKGTIKRPSCVPYLVKGWGVEIAKRKAGQLMVKVELEFKSICEMNQQLSLIGSINKDDLIEHCKELEKLVAYLKDTKSKEELDKHTSKKPVDYEWLFSYMIESITYSRKYLEKKISP